MQAQDLPENSDTVAIEEGETVTKGDNLEESDMDENDIEPKRDVSYVILLVYSKFVLIVSDTYSIIFCLNPVTGPKSI